MAIEAASFGRKPKASALNRVINISICAAASRSMSLGLASNEEKSVIASNPGKTIDGYKQLVALK